MSSTFAGAAAGSLGGALSLATAAGQSTSAASSNSSSPQLLVSMTSVAVHACQAVAGGGLTFMGTGTLSITQSNFTTNTALGTSPAAGSCGGGAMLVQGAVAVTMSGCSLTENQALGDSRDGGAICIQAGQSPGTPDLSANELRFYRNSASGKGGSIAAGPRASLHMSRSTVSLDSAGTAGGSISAMNTGRAELRDVEISGTYSFGRGGAVAAEATGLLLVSRCSILAARAGQGGGAMFISNTATIVQGCEVSICTCLRMLCMLWCAPVHAR